MTDKIVDKLLDRLEQTNKELATTKEFKETAQFAERLARDETGSFEILSKEFELPLKIAGTAISEGDWNDKFYPADELEQSAPSLVDCPITVDHPWIPEDNEPLMVMDEVGKVNTAEYDSTKKAVEFEGFIVDEDIARRVYHDLVDTVSVGIGPRDIEEKDGKPIVTNMNFFELSLVKNPACKDAKFDVLSKAINGHVKTNQKEVNPKMTEDEKSQETESKNEEEKNVEQPEMVLVPKNVLDNIESDDLKYYGYYPYYYPYKYPYKDKKSDDDSISREEFENKIGAIESALQDIAKTLQEDEDEDEEEEEASQESEEENEMEEKIEELSQKVEELESTPDRKSQPSGGEGEVDIEQLAEDNFEKLAYKWLEFKEG